MSERKYTIDELKTVVNVLEEIYPGSTVTATVIEEMDSDTPPRCDGEDVDGK